MVPPPCFFILSPPALRVFLSFFGFFSPFFFFLPFFFLFCSAVVCWLCGAGLVCPGLLVVLVCVVVGLVLRRGPVRACPLSFRASPHVPPPFVLLPVVLRMPGGAVLGVLLRPALQLVGALWCCPPNPLGALRRFFFFCLSAVCWFCHPPPSPAGCGALCCALSYPGLCGAAVCGVFCVVPGDVWRACVGLGSCAVLFGAVLCWVFLCYFCRALLSCAAAFSAFFLRCSLPFGRDPRCLRFCALLVRCCAGVPASLLSVRCSLAPAALAGVLCCCLLGLRLCCWAWLSSVFSFWVLVAPGVVFPWCGVVFPWGLCCAVLLRVVPPGVVLLCAVLLCFALFGAVAPCVVSWGPVCRPEVLCIPALCFFLSPRAVCVLLWCVAAWYCSPLCFVRCASWGVVLCVSCPPRPGRCCCAALLSLGACSPVLCPVVLCCRVVLWCPILLPCMFCFLCLFGFSYLKTCCKIC